MGHAATHGSSETRSVIPRLAPKAGARTWGTQLDHTWFRQYSSRQGRWMSVDPLFGDLSDPQSLNRYAYVLNSPTIYIDPWGLKWEIACIEVNDGLGHTWKECNRTWIPDPSDEAPSSGFFTSDLLRRLGHGVREVGEFISPSLRLPGQTVGECIEQHSHEFSAVGALDLVAGTNYSETFAGNLLGGNDVSGLALAFAGSTSSASTEGLAAVTSEAALHGTVKGAGKALLTSGPSGVQRLFPKVGRPAQALLREGALTKGLAVATGYAEVKGAADLGLVGALALACR